MVTTGPNSNAFQVLETLNILEAFDLRSMGHNSADYIHTVSEAIKIAVPDRIAYGGDPNFMDVPVAGLLTKEYARGRRSLINHKQASTVIGERYTENPAGGRDSGGDAERVHERGDDALLGGGRGGDGGEHHADAGGGFRLPALLRETRGFC